MKKFIYILLCLLLLTGCSNNEESKDKNKEKDKIIAELDYCSTTLSDILNSLNNISLENYELISNKIQISEQTEDSTSSSAGSQNSSSNSSDNDENVKVTEMKASSILNTNTEQIDWDILRNKIEITNNYWSVVMLDLHNNNVSNEDIMNFGNILDQCTISINNEDKINTLNNVSLLYSYIPNFLNIIEADSSIQNITNTKNYVIQAYVAINNDDWGNVNTNLNKAEKTFTIVLNNIDYTKNKEYKVNKTYMAIKDFQNSLKNEDKSLAFLKYKSLIESLNVL